MNYYFMSFTICGRGHDTRLVEYNDTHLGIEGVYENMIKYICVENDISIEDKHLIEVISFNKV